MKDVQGQTVLITGGAQGMGREWAQQFADDGANLVLWDIKADLLTETADRLRTRGVDVMTQVVDVSDREAVYKAAMKVQAETGGVDILVNNAGMAQFSPIQAVPGEELERTMRVNLFSYFYMAKHAVENMIARQVPGCVINISSILGMIGGAGKTVYAASKGGVTGFTVGLAREVARYGIRVNAIAPGYIETEMTEWMPQEHRDKLIPRIPMRRFGSVEEVGKAVAFLIEDATYTTGQTLVLDGGILVD